MLMKWVLNICPVYFNYKFNNRIKISVGAI